MKTAVDRYSSRRFRGVIPLQGCSMKKNMLSGFVALGFLSCSFPAAGTGTADVDPDLPSVEKDKKKNPYLVYSNPPTAMHSIYSDLNRIKWLSVPPDSTAPLDKAKCDAISDTYIAHCRRVAESAAGAKASSAWIDLGVALLYRSRWDDASAAFEKARAAASGNGHMTAYSMYMIAECHMGAGRFQEARRVLHELLSGNYQSGGYSGRMRRTNWNRKAREVLHWMDGNSLCRLGLPRWTGYKAFPEPKESKYTDSFVPAGVLTLSAGGIAEDDARFRFFREKLAFRGVKIAEEGGYRVTVVLDPAAPVDKSEGYYLEATEKGARILARDRQGILWGLVSFLQIYDYEAKRMRVCSLKDWPDCPKRGFLGRCSVYDLEFMLFNKMNINTAKPNFLSGGQYTPFNLYKTRKMAGEYRDLGLELYYGFASFTMNIAWPLCWNVFLEMQVENAKIWASCGVGIYYPYDDARYWPSVYTEEDKATGLKPSDYDARHLLKFFNRVKEEYPDFKMQFCAPFYWGPRRGHPYPDDRTKYLESLRCLPHDDVSMFWTGERVGSKHKTKSDCDWYAERIGRRPSLFQNKAGPHYYHSYVLDEMPWDEWYYPGFVEKDMRSIQKNSDTPQDYPILSTLADYLWNVAGYDRKRSVKNGLEHYAGKGIYDALKSAYDKLCRIDRYKYGRVNSRVLQEDAAEWEQASKEIHEATKKAEAIAGPVVMNGGFGSWKLALGWFDGVLRAIKNPPDYRRKYAGPYKKLREHLAADSVSAYDGAGGDVFIDPLDIKGVAIGPYPTSRRKPVMTNSTVVAILHPECTASAKFEIADQSPARSRSLFLRGISHPYPPLFKVELNGKLLYEGKNPFGAEKGSSWTTFRFEMPAAMLVRGTNELKFFNDKGYVYPIYLEYGVIK